MKRLLAIFTGRHQPDRDALSAYLDGELASERAAALEAHVAGCEACSTMLEGMRDVRTMLRALPQADAPRSFRVRPEVAAEPRRGIPAPPAPLLRAMPVLSAAAVIVFAITVSLDVAGGGNGDNGSSAARVAMSDSAGTEALEQGGPPAPEDESFNADRGATQDAPAAGSLAPAATATTAAAARAAADESAGGAAPDATAIGATAYAELAQGDSATDDDGERDLEATSVGQDDDDGNKLALRIVQIASAAVAIVAAGVALRMWRKQGETVV
ncbi:MAG: zf-HC2 domain-containing protein [Dehalococcoidia bacterium]